MTVLPAVEESPMQSQMQCGTKGILVLLVNVVNAAD